jgi:succinate-semialdehyde dehydrogenase/glutarate-semialdehyde dehydrogenase
MTAKFRNSGQSCIGGNRVYVQAGIYDAFAAALAERAASLVVGPGLQPDSQIGPLIDQAAVEKVEAHIADATAGGAAVLSGGSSDPRGGRFFTPTVLSDVLPGMLVTREETFGPLLPLIRFHSEAEVVAWANDSEYGLAAYLFTQDAERTWRIAEALETGMVGINTGMVSNEVAPFGGIKQSGLGREGSVHGIDEYLELKYLAWENARGVPLSE